MKVGDPTTAPAEQKSAYVRGDSIPDLKHPVTGEIIDSRSKWNAINKAHGLEVVGNDLLSKKKHQLQEKITDSRIMNAIEKAEATYSDPSKFRAAQNESRERLERRQRLLYGNH